MQIRNTANNQYQETIVLVNKVNQHCRHPYIKLKN